MLEFRILRSDVVGCFAQRLALDQLERVAELAIRVAPNELLVLGERERLGQIREELDSLDAQGVALDLSPAYFTLSLAGDDQHEAFRRLSALELAPAMGVEQGLFAHVPAKVVRRKSDVIVLTSSTHEHHVRGRLLASCRDIQLIEREAVAGAVA